MFRFTVKLITDSVDKSNSLLAVNTSHHISSLPAEVHIEKFGIAMFN